MARFEPNMFLDIHNVQKRLKDELKTFYKKETRKKVREKGLIKLLEQTYFKKGTNIAVAKI